MKNIIIKKYRAIYLKGMRLLLLSIIPMLAFQLFATSKLHVEIQKNNISWKTGIDYELINKDMNRLGSDIIFISGFEPVPIILAFTANPAIINAGDSTALTWELSNNATECIKSGDWSGTTAFTNGIHSETISNIVVDSTFNLVCANSFGTSPSRTVTVSVNNGNVNCANQPPILNGDEDFTVKLIPGASPGQLGSPQDPAPYNGTYDDIAPGNGWPGVFGTQSFFNLTSNKYIAMQFNTNNTNAIAKLIFTAPGNGQGPPSTATTVAISECPGDFTTHLNQARCLRIGGGIPNLRWSQNPNTNTLTHCILEKNRIYYLNIVHSNSTANGYSTTSCTSTNCGAIFSHINENQ
jgi:hypothetical protein